MMDRVFAICCFLALSCLSSIETFNSQRALSAKVETSNLIKGIPDNFDCYGPSRLELENANTMMLCGGKLCLVHCKDHYKPLSKIPFVYVCHKDGYWTTIPFKNTIKGYEIKWPVCYYDGL